MAKEDLQFVISVDSDGVAKGVKRSKTAFDDLEKSAKKAAKTLTKGQRDAQVELEKSRRAYEKLKKSGTASSDALMKAKMRVVRASKLLNKELKGTTKELRKTGAAARSAGSGFSAMAAPLSAVVAGMAALVASMDALKAFAGFDDTMRQVGAVTNATAQEMADLTAIAKEMGEKTRFSAVEASEGLKFMGMAGFTAQQQITALPGVLNLAAAGAMDLGEAADIATNILTGYGKEVSDLAEVNDILSKTFTSSNTSLQELGYAFTYVGPVAKSAGYAMTETAAALAVFANAGYKGEMGGTALRGAIVRLLDPVPKAASAIAELGLQVKDSSGKMRPMTEIMKDLGTAGADTEQIIKIFGMRAGPAMASAIGQGTEAIDGMVAKIEDYKGTTDRIATEMEAGIGGLLRALKSAFESVKLAAGESISKELGDNVQELTTYLRENGDEVADFAKDFAKLIGLMIDGGVVVADFITSNKDLIIAIAAVTAGTKAYGIALGTTIKLQKLGILSTASLSKHMGKAGLAGSLIFTTMQLINLTKEINGWREATNQAKGATERAEEAEKALNRTWAERSRIAGVTITDVKSMNQAIADGLIHKNKETGAWVKGAAAQTSAVKALSDAKKQALQEDSNYFSTSIADSYKAIPAATGKALAESQTLWDSYTKEILSLQDKIINKERSLAEQLRDIGREGMSNIGAWRDRRAEANEYAAAAKKAAKAGDEEEAIRLSQAAQEAYGDLITEIKDGEKTLVSKASSSEYAAKKIEEQGKLEIAMLKAIKAEKEAIADLENEKAGFILGDQYTEAGEKAKELNDQAKEFNALIAESGTEWGKVWELMETSAEAAIDATEQRLVKLTADRSVTVYVNEVVQRADGGLAQGFATGGSPAFRRASGAVNWGAYGVDKVPAMLTRNEYVLKESSVRAGGVDLASAHNRGDWAGMASILSTRLNIPSMDGIGQQTGQTITRRLVIDDKQTGQQMAVHGSRVDLDGLEKLMARRHKYRSAS